MNCLNCKFQDCINDEDMTDAERKFSVQFETSLKRSRSPHPDMTIKYVHNRVDKEEYTRERNRLYDVKRYPKRREKMLEYKKKHYREHREEKLSYQNDYYIKHREEVNARNKAYYEAHKVEINAKRRQRYAERKEKENAVCREEKQA